MCKGMVRHGGCKRQAPCQPPTGAKQSFLPSVLFNFFSSFLSTWAQTDAMFRVQHTDPWVRGDAHRTSRTTTIQVGGWGTRFFGAGSSIAGLPAGLWLNCACLRQACGKRAVGPTPLPCPLQPRPPPAQNDKQSAAPIHGRAMDDVEAAGAPSGCAAVVPATPFCHCSLVPAGQS